MVREELLITFTINHSGEDDSLFETLEWAYFKMDSVSKGKQYLWKDSSEYGGD
jgi:hypothetical protein